LKSSSSDLDDPKLWVRLLVGAAIASSLLGENATSLLLPIWLGPALVLAILLVLSGWLWRHGSTRARIVVLSISALAGALLGASLYGAAA
jgi:hypothetical protein